MVFMSPPEALARRQAEKLGRGVVAVNRGDGEVCVGWRLLGTDPDGMAFNAYRVTGGGKPVKLNKAPITASTNLVDAAADLKKTNAWFVRPIVDGKEQAACVRFTLNAGAAARRYIAIPLKTPEGCSPNDASVGDLDGDGEYEIVLKQEMRPRDNSHAGATGRTRLEAYKLNGKFLWRIDLGPNVREGAHYTPFIVYDLDGDGRAEVACRTADGTVDGAGKTIGNANANHRNSKGYVLRGPEFLTIFDGVTISKWDHLAARETRLLSADGCARNNGTKSNPCIQADILGDWREEVIWRTSDNRELRIYTTTIPSKRRFYTFMHDPVYRLGVAWQNVGYNQPAQVGFYMGAGMSRPPRPKIAMPRLR